jgi:hypothetical protein
MLKQELEVIRVGKGGQHIRFRGLVDRRSDDAGRFAINVATLCVDVDSKK